MVVGVDPHHLCRGLTTRQERREGRKVLSLGECFRSVIEHDAHATDLRGGRRLRRRYGPNWSWAASVLVGQTAGGRVLGRPHGPAPLPERRLPDLETRAGAQASGRRLGLRRMSCAPGRGRPGDTEDRRPPTPPRLRPAHVAGSGRCGAPAGWCGAGGPGSTPRAQSVARVAGSLVCASRTAPPLHGPAPGRGAGP